MKLHLIAASALILLSAAASAQAADVVDDTPPPEAPAAPVQPAFSWTGFYAGGTVGGSWANADTRTRVRRGDNTVTVKKKLKPDGFIGGIYAGYNFQVKDNIVLGAETDFLWDDVENSKKLKLGDDGYTKWRVKQKWNGATRLRAGYAFDRFLPYVAAGVSYAEVKGLYLDGVNKSGKPKDRTRAGWNAGVGIDYVPPILNDHIVLRAEYRYTDFGKKTYKVSDDARYRVKYNQNDFRVGIAYKF